MLAGRKIPDLNLSDAFRLNLQNQNCNKDKSLMFSTLPQKQSACTKVRVNKWAGFNVPHFSYAGTVSIEKSLKDADTNRTMEDDPLDQMIDSDLPIVSGTTDLRMFDIGGPRTTTNRSMFPQKVGPDLYNRENFKNYKNL